MLQDEAIMLQIGHVYKDGGKLWVILNNEACIGYAFAKVVSVAQEMKVCVIHKEYEHVPAVLSSQLNQEIAMWSIAQGAGEMTVPIRSLS